MTDPYRTPTLTPPVAPATPPLWRRALCALEELILAVGYGLVHPVMVCKHEAFDTDQLPYAPRWARLVRRFAAAWCLTMGVALGLIFIAAFVVGLTHDAQCRVGP